MAKIKDENKLIARVVVQVKRGERAHVSIACPDLLVVVDVALSVVGVVVVDVVGHEEEVVARGDEPARRTDHSEAEEHEGAHEARCNGKKSTSTQHLTPVLQRS